MRCPPPPEPSLCSPADSHRSGSSPSGCASAVPADAFFYPDDFMFVSWAVDCPGDVKVFKHVDTRQLIVLDADGAAYRTVATASRPPRPLREAVDAVGLWELPWLRRISPPTGGAAVGTNGGSSTPSSPAPTSIGPRDPCRAASSARAGRAMLAVCASSSA